MRIHELHDPDRDVLIIDTDGHFMVIGQCGAVFMDSDTSEPLNMAVASANLFKDNFSLPTPEQRQWFMAQVPGERVLVLSWNLPEQGQRKGQPLQ